MIALNLVPDEVIAEQEGRWRVFVLCAWLVIILCIVCVGEWIRMARAEHIHDKVARRDELLAEVSELTQKTRSLLNTEEESRNNREPLRRLRNQHHRLADLLLKLPSMVSAETSITEIRSDKNIIVLSGIAAYPEAARQLRERLRTHLGVRGVVIDEISTQESSEYVHFQLSLMLEPTDTQSAAQE